MSKFSDLFEEHTMRADTVIWLDALGYSSEVGTKDFQEFVEECLEDDPVTQAIIDDLPALSKGLKWAVEDELSDRETCEVILGDLAFNNVTGFLLKVSSPVREYRDNGMSSFSWGHVHYGWVYGPDLDTAAERAAAMASGWNAADRQRVLA